MPGLLLPLLIRYFVVSGIATATEVSVVGIFYTLLVGVFVYREFDWNAHVSDRCSTPSRSSGAILLIIATATAMGWALTQSGFAQQLADDARPRAGRHDRHHAVLDRALHRPRLGARGDPGDGAVRRRCSFRSRKRPASTKCTTRSSPCSRWGSASSRRRSASGSSAPARSAKPNPENVVRPIVPYLAALVISLLLIAFIPWLSLGFLPKPGGP